jgi:hypothetical protein
MAKLEPVPLTVVIQLGNPITRPGDPLLDRYYIDISQIACLMSRKFLRQGLNWGVAGFKILDTNPGVVTINKLPNSWVMSNSWHKSFASWTEMNNEALAESESVRPRFLDFKIYANSTHHANGFAGNQLPIGGGNLPGVPNNSVYLPGEWESSKLRIPIGPTQPGVTTDYEVIAVGENYPGASPVTGKNAVSCIEGYAASRGLPNVLDPNVPADASDADGVQPQNWMAALKNEGTEQVEEVLEDMITENNIAPYPFENDGVAVDTMYPGGANQAEGLEIHDVGVISPTTIGGMTTLKGGNFPCGLIEITCSVEMAPIVIINLIPGFERGYLAEPMQDM